VALIQAQNSRVLIGIKLGNSLTGEHVMSLNPQQTSGSAASSSAQHLEPSRPTRQPARVAATPTKDAAPGFTNNVLFLGDAPLAALRARLLADKQN
jgi:hypothetical protein